MKKAISIFIAAGSLMLNVYAVKCVDSMPLFDVGEIFNSNEDPKFSLRVKSDWSPWLNGQTFMSNIRHTTFDLLYDSKSIGSVETAFYSFDSEAIKKSRVNNQKVITHQISDTEWRSEIRHDPNDMSHINRYGSHVQIKSIYFIPLFPRGPVSERIPDAQKVLAILLSIYRNIPGLEFTRFVTNPEEYFSPTGIYEKFGFSNQFSKAHVTSELSIANDNTYTALKVPESNFCSACDNSHDLMCCSKCKKAYYCNRECQQQHWRVHKKTCVSSD